MLFYEIAVNCDVARVAPGSPANPVISPARLWHPVCTGATLRALA